MKMQQLCGGPLLSAQANETLSDVVDRMTFYQIDALVVLDGTTLAGIITAQDLVRALSDRADFDAVDVGEYMTPAPIVVDIDADTSEAVDKMIRFGIRHLPVVDRHHVLAIVTMPDLLTLEHTEHAGTG